MSGQTSLGTSRGQRLNGSVQILGTAGRLLLDNAREAIAIIQDGVMKVVNPSLVKRMGYSEHELTSRPFLDFIHPDDQQMVAEHHLRRLKGEEGPSSYPVRIVDKGGNTRWAKVKTLLLDWDGRPAVLAFLTDITERNKAETDLRVKDHAMTSSISAIAILDVEGKIIYVNPSFLEMWKLNSSAEALDKSLPEIAAALDGVRLAEITETLLNKGSWSGELEASRFKDGSKLTVLLSVSLVGDEGGQRIGAVASFIDITELRRIHEELAGLSSAFMTATEGISIVGMDGIIRETNEAALKFYGQEDKKNVVGKSILDFLAPEESERVLAHLHDVTQSGHIPETEFEIVVRGGHRLTVAVSGTLVRDDAGNPTAFVAIYRDVSERKKAEEALRRREEYFRTIIERSSDVITVLDSAGTVQYQSPNYRNIWGRDPSGEVGRDLFKDVHPDDIPLVGEAFKRLLEKPGDLAHIEVRARHEDKTWRVLDVEARNLLDDPAVRGIVVNFCDITERKRMEEDLRQSEQQWRTLFDHTLDGMVIYDPESGKTVLVNRAAAHIFGFPDTDSVVGTNPMDYVPEEDREVVIREIAEDIAGGLKRIRDIRMRTWDGRMIWASIMPTMTKYQGRSAILLSVRDITERRHMEENLQRQERHFRALIERSSDVIVVLDRNGTARYVSPSVENALGITRSQVEGASFLTSMHPDDAQQAAEDWDYLLKHPGGTTKGERRIRSADGSWRHVEAIGYSLLHDPVVEGVVVNIRDITKRKEAEEALKESEKRYRMLAENVSDVIWVTDLNLRPVYTSPSIERLLGYSVEESMSRGMKDSLVPASLQRAAEAFSKVFSMEEAAAQAAFGTIPLELEFKRKDGSTIWVATTVSVMRDADGRPVGIMGVLRDITARRRADELFAALATSSPVGIYIVSDHKFQFVNPQTENYSGYSKDGLLAMDPIQLVVPDDRNNVREHAVRMLKGEDFAPYEYRIVTKSGEVRWVTETVSSIQYQGRRAVLGNFMDTTEQHAVRQRLEESLEKLQRTIEGTVQAITLTVEVRDPFTAGHQRRVAQLAGAMAQEMGFSSEEVRVIRIAGLVHDIGKVCIPSEILCKPGQISKVEFSLIKTHCQVGHDILKRVQFPWPIADMVIQHHERIDGSGYPSGLREDEILMEARILGVADVVEAMTSHRPYRPAPGIDEALEEISHNSGRLYDADAVYACLKLFREKGFAFDDRGLGSEWSSL